MGPQPQAACGCVPSDPATYLLRGGLGGPRLHLLTGPECPARPSGWYPGHPQGWTEARRTGTEQVLGARPALRKGMASSRFDSFPLSGLLGLVTSGLGRHSLSAQLWRCLVIRGRLLGRSSPWHSRAVLGNRAPFLVWPLMGMQMVQPLGKTVQSFLMKLHTVLPDKPAATLLGPLGLTAHRSRLWPS